MDIKNVFVNLFLVISFTVQHCNGVIYQLTDAEYDRMPPLFELDKYESCLRQNQDVYCVVQVDLISDPLNDVSKLIQEYSKHTTMHYNHSKIERGICLKKTCSKYIGNRQLGNVEDLESVLVECINDTIWKDYRMQTNVTKFYCDKNNTESDKDIFDWLVLWLIIAITTLNIAGSMYDLIVQRQNREKNNNIGVKYYLLCFSMIQNWNWLVSFESGDPRLRKLKGLHCVKTIIMYLFIIGHSFYVFHGFTENPHQLEKYYNYFFFKLLFNGLIIVQILFAISGFLLTYNLLIRAENTLITWKYIPKVILLRLWRLTPANAVYVLFSATWLRHWGSGPLWKMFITDKMSGDCRKYWWSHLLYINNYFPDDKFCVVQNWQLAADVQLYVFGLCVFVATRASGRMLANIIFILLGMITMGLHIWWQDLSAFLITTPEVYRTLDSKNYVVHKFAHVNLPSFVIGMLVGQLAYELQKGNVVFRHKKALSYISHCVIPSIMLVFYSGSIFYEDGDRTSLSLRIAYGVMLRPVMAIITAYIIIGMIMRFDDFWIRFLDWDGWLVPSKLTYSVSLIHTFYIFILYGTRTQLMQISALNHTFVHLGVAVLSFLTALPYFLMIEAPMNRLMKLIITKNDRLQNKVE